MPPADPAHDDRASSAIGEDGGCVLRWFTDEAFDGEDADWDGANAGYRAHLASILGRCPLRSARSRRASIERSGPWTRWSSAVTRA